MDHDHRFGVRIFLKGSSKCLGIHVPGVRLGINKYRSGLLIYNGIAGSTEGQAGGKHYIPLTDSQNTKRQMNGCRAGTECCRMTGSRIRCKLLLKIVDIRSKRCHPVGVKCLPDKFLLLPMHGGGRQINSFLCHIYSLPKRQFFSLKTASSS